MEQQNRWWERLYRVETLLNLIWTSLSGGAVIIGALITGDPPTFTWAMLFFFGGILALSLAFAVGAWGWRAVRGSNLRSANQSASMDEAREMQQQLRLHTVSITHLHSGLYIGAIDVTRVGNPTRGRIVVRAHGFNATGCILHFRRSIGSIEVLTIEKGKRQHVGTLQPPTILVNNDPNGKIFDCSEFHITFEQSGPAEVLSKIDDIKEKKEILLNFENIEVLFDSKDKPDGTFRLPIWTTVRLYRPAQDAILAELTGTSE